jgi:hypothetical protein
MGFVSVIDIAKSELVDTAESKIRSVVAIKNFLKTEDFSRRKFAFAKIIWGNINFFLA